MEHGYEKFSLTNKEACDIDQYDILLSQNPMPLYRLQPWPLILSQNQFTRLKEASTGITLLLQSIPERLFNKNIDKMMEYYGFDFNLKFLDLSFSNDSLKDVVYRPDFIYTNQEWKCMEINAGNAGGWVISLLAPLYGEIPIIKRYMKETVHHISAPDTVGILFKHLISNACRNLKFFSRYEINMAIIVPKNSTGEFNDYCLNKCRELYRKALSEILPSYTGNLFFCQYDDLEFNDGVLFQDFVIQIIYEEDIILGSNRMKALRLAQKNKISLNPGTRTRFLNDKRHLALLSENKDNDVFDDLEKKLINDFVPWTRRALPVEATYKNEVVYLPDFACNNRENIVVKKSFSHGGQDVYLGKMLNKKQWESLLIKIFKEKDWVFQDYLSSESFVLQTENSKTKNYDVVWGPFIISNKYAGGFIRILDQAGYTPRIGNSENAALVDTFNSDSEAQIAPIFS